MGYRELTMLEIRDVLMPWCGGTAKKPIAAQLGLGIKTMRRYQRAACGRASTGQ